MDKEKESQGLTPLMWIALLGFLILAWPAIYTFLYNTFGPFINSLGIDYPRIFGASEYGGLAIVDDLVAISIPVSVFFLIAIIYTIEQLKYVRKKEAEKHDLKIEPAFEDVPSQGNRDLSVRWKKVTDLLNSENQNDWKQAILESDTMLDLILANLGYQGESIGEKLKRVQTGDMKHLDDAWEAHKVRNQIAHEGSFALTHHEAVETIHRYRRVFEEFYLV